MGTQWLDEDELVAWVRLASVMELLPGVLDSQLRRDAELMHYEYFVLAMLSEAPQRTLRMTALAARTNATPARLSHVVRRLEDRDFIERFPCPHDARVTNARLTGAGFDKVRNAAPGHVATVRRTVIDALTTKQVHHLAEIGEAILGRLDPEGTMSTAPYLADRAARVGSKSRR
ncbi:MULTISPECIES: MarR family winged helix-turn-helix transcriptional regulator [unclassified Mycobacterium]|uniref:MarR family winged helix-turn-helix transcriptional regulator n=1 Tax=unclassified Mycobacterium TaxID=2642494 RepID=UPI0029C97F6E|nr:MULTISPECIES: MarR family transcriptional regulator [unclassified Mycobacterium]